MLRGPETRMPFLTAASAAPTLSIELSTIVSAAAIIITVLLALLSGMAGLGLLALRREITRNDEAHRELRADIGRVEADVKTVEADVKALLAGQARIEGLLRA